MRALWGCPQEVPYTTSCSFLLTSLNFLICVCARLPATASASVSVGCRHLLAASLQQSLLRDMPVIPSALLISKLLQPGRGQRWSLLGCWWSLLGCWCCQKAAWVSAFRNSWYSCGHLKDLHVITLEKQLFSWNQKIRVLFLYRNTAWRLHSMGLHSHSCLKTAAKYHISENACLTTCITKRKWDWERECLKIISSKRTCFQQNPQWIDFSVQSSRVFSVFFLWVLKILESAVKNLYTGWVDDSSA